MVRIHASTEDGWRSTDTADGHSTEHTRQILKQAQQQVIDKYTQIVEVLRDPYDLVHRTYKNKDGTTGVTTGITYLCLQCPNVSISRERHRKDHSFGRP